MNGQQNCYFSNTDLSRLLCFSTFTFVVYSFFSLYIEIQKYSKVTDEGSLSSQKEIIKGAFVWLIVSLTSWLAASVVPLPEFNKFNDIQITEKKAPQDKNRHLI